jgi:glycerophosphoryl diester phosphodiesterase
LAWTQGADGVEGDFRLTADSQIVCIHDADTKRVSDKKLIVNDSTLAQLKTLDVGEWKGEAFRGERIPTLAEVLQTVPPGKRFVIELKTGPEIVAPLAAVLQQSAIPAEAVLLIAFDEDVIVACKTMLPSYRRHLLVRYNKQEDGSWSPTLAQVVAALQRSGADGLGSKCHPEIFDANFVARLGAAGYPEFHVWTVDDPVVARFYQQLGAWGLTTNRPGRLRQELQDEAARSD